jgi:hypothetical protein
MPTPDEVTSLLAARGRPVPGTMIPSWSATEGTPL